MYIVIYECSKSYANLVSILQYFCEKHYKKKNSLTTVTLWSWMASNTTCFSHHRQKQIYKGVFISWMRVTFNLNLFKISLWQPAAHFFSFSLFILAGTNSELSNASETEEMGERELRPKGVGSDDRGSRRGGRGRGSSAGRGRGGPGPRNTNTISSGTSRLGLIQN